MESSIIDELASTLGCLSARLNAANAATELGTIMRQLLSVAVARGVHGKALEMMAATITELETPVLFVEADDDEGYEGSVP